MRIRYIAREEVSRFGTGVFTVPDERGVQLVRAGRARAEIDPARPAVSKIPNKEKAVKVDGKKFITPGRPLVGWIHDTEKLGGAELSNQTVLGVGKKLGVGIYECFPRTFDKSLLAKCDFLIINNFFFFEDAQYHFILDLLFEHGMPFVKYEHDHREIIGDQARHGLARLLFGRSFLNVFISPFQLNNHRKHLGDVIDACWVLPPAIDTSIFKLLPEVPREKNKVVNLCGKLYESKGFRHMLHFCLAKEKEYSFEIYTKNEQEVRPVFKEVKNVKVHSLLPNKSLPEIYNSAEYTIHIPQALEACGRSIAEGILCGCKPLINKNVGIGSFDEYHIGNEKRFKLDRFREAVKNGPWRFWKEVELHFRKLK